MLLREARYLEARVHHELSAGAADGGNAHHVALRDQAAERFAAACQYLRCRSAENSSTTHQDLAAQLHSALLNSEALAF